MSDYTLDELWRRVGEWWLAKSILRDGRVVARIVDITEPVDLPPGDPRHPPEQYILERLKGDKFVRSDAAIYPSARAAFESFIIEAGDRE